MTAPAVRAYRTTRRQPPKSEFQKAEATLGHFGFRVSAFFRPSDFGLRVWAFALTGWWYCQDTPPLPPAASRRQRQSRSYGTYLMRKNPALPLTLTCWVLVVAVGVNRSPTLLHGPPSTGANSSW